MIAIAALSAGSMFLITDGAYQKASTLGAGSMMTGNVEVIVRDDSGQPIAYRQSDNHIVQFGLDLLAKQVFYSSGAGNLTNASGVSGGQVRFMEIGNGSGTLTWNDQTLDRPLSSFAGCTRQEATFTHTNASNAGGFAQVNVTAVATFDGSAGCVAENIKEAGIWNNVTSGPGEGGVSPGPGGLNSNTEPTMNVMFARNTFGNVTLQSTDSLQLTWRFTFTDS